MSHNFDASISDLKNPHSDRTTDRSTGEQAVRELSKICDLEIETVATTLRGNFLDIKSGSALDRLSLALSSDSFHNHFNSYHGLKTSIAGPFKSDNYTLLITFYTSDLKLVTIKLPVQCKPTKTGFGIGTKLTGNDFKVSVTRDKFIGRGKAEQHFLDFQGSFEQKIQETLEILKKTNFSDLIVPSILSIIKEIENSKDNESESGESGKVIESLEGLNNLISRFLWAQDQQGLIDKESLELLALIIFAMLTAISIRAIVPGIEPGQKQAAFGGLVFDSILAEADGLLQYSLA